MNRSTQFAAAEILVPADKANWLAASMEEFLRVTESADFASVEREFAASDNFWSEDSWLASFRPYNVVDGVLQVPVRGMLLDDFSYAMRGVTGYEYIVRAVQRGAEDSAVRGIALVVNSYGGTVAGAFDAADKLYAARSAKPIRAILAEHAYSAAYLLASTAKKITVPRTGGTGSIGVVTMHVDYSGMLKDAGIKVTLIASGEHKTDGNQFEPLSKDAKAEIQARLDLLRGIFVEHVARNRKLEEKAVHDTEARCYMADDSLSVGLADEVAAPDQALRAFAADLNPQPKRRTIMTTPTEEKSYSQAQFDAACNTARTEGADAERTRVSAILNLEASKTRHAAALSLALTTPLTVDQCSTLLATFPEDKVPEAAKPDEKTEDKAKGSHFDEAMAKGAPDVGANNNAGDDGTDTPESRSARMLGAHSQASGRKYKAA